MPRCGCRIHQAEYEGRLEEEMEKMVVESLVAKGVPESDAIWALNKIKREKNI